MRPAKKEYSDLPAAQKHTYLLENVITFCAALTTTLIWIAWVIFAVSQNPHIMENDSTLEEKSPALNADLASKYIC